VNPESLLKKVQQLFLEGLPDSSHPFHQAVLSTCHSSQPNLRYVVIRAYQAESFFIFTDFRSSKVKELRENPQSQLLFYHQPEKIQVRLSGSVSIHHRNAIAEKYIKQLPDQAFREYTSNASPGTVLQQPEAAFEYKKELLVDNFCVLEVVADRIEILQLSRNGHKRAQFYSQKGSWQGNWIAP
jgi:pyridoxine/pyridoxamine 5'-phosphate oxidase